MGSNDSARDICSALLAELDDDIREYIISMLEGDEDQDEKEEAVYDFLLSTGLSPDEDAATAKCRELFAAIKPSSAIVRFTAVCLIVARRLRISCSAGTVLRTGSRVRTRLPPRL